MPEGTEQVTQAQPVIPPAVAAAVVETEHADPGDDSAGRGDRDDLIAALQEGDKETVETEAAEETATAAAAKAKEDAASAAATNGAAAAGAATASEPKIAAIIRAREEAQRKRQEAVDDAAGIRAEADAYRTRIETEARASAAAQLEAEKAKFLQRFREAPTDALAEAGVPRDRLIDDVAKEGTPEWRMMKRLEAERASDRKELEELKAWKSDQSKQAELRQQEAQRHALVQVEQTFLREHAAPEKTPLLRKLPDALVITMAHKQAAEWRDAGIPFAHSDVAEYLEHEIRKSFGSADGSQQVGSPNGNSAPKAKANGTRTLSAQGASERRASPKPYEELDFEDPTAAKASLLEAFRDGKP